MIRTPRAALAIAAATLGVSVVAAPLAAQQQQQQPAGQKPAKDFQLTKEVRNLASEAQTLAQAGDLAGARAKIDQALPLGKTADDRYVLGSIMLEAAGTDLGVQRRAVDTMIQSGVPTGTELAQLQFFSGRFAYSAGEYDKASQLFTAARTGGHQDPKLIALIADSQLKANQPAQGMATLRQAVEAEIAANRKPDEDWLKRGLSAAVQSKQPDQLSWWSQAYLKSYPSDRNWRNALLIYRDGAQLDAQTQLDLFRLMRATKALAGERDFVEYADSANDRGLPGEAKAVIDEGRAAGAVGADTPAVREIYNLVSGKVKADQASLPASEKSAAAAKDGKLAASTADAYLGYKNYTKAAELYQIALTKGGVDANQVNTRLGIALALSGQKPAAKEAFGKVTGPRNALADYWELYLDQTA